MIAKYQFIKDIIKLTFVNQIILFGSRARNDNDERSDIDLAINCIGATDNDWQRILETVDTCDTLLDINCIRFDALRDDDKLKSNILKQGKIIYDKGQQFMHKEYWQDTFEALGQAVSRFREAYNKAKAESVEFQIYRDAVIQRFEFTVELFWKILKKFLNYEKIEVNTPREVLKKSYAARMIDEEEKWLKMMNDRNLTSHTYKEDIAEEIFHRIEFYLPLLEQTYAKLQRKYQEM